MHIQLNTDSHIVGSDALSADVEQKVNSALKRFSDRITRVEVHLSDLNSAKAGPDDKRCVMETRVAGMNPISACHQAPTLALAVDGSLEKLSRALGSAFGKCDAIRHGPIKAPDDVEPAK